MILWDEFFGASFWRARGLPSWTYEDFHLRSCSTRQIRESCIEPTDTRCCSVEQVDANRAVCEQGHGRNEFVVDITQCGGDGDFFA